MGALSWWQARAGTAETVAQWNFEGSLASSTGQAALTAASAAPAAAPAVTFEDAVIGGQAVKVAHFSRGTYFRVHPGFPANGGGVYVNQFTLILDVMFPDRSPSGGWAALLQTNDTNSNDGDWFVSPAGGVGVSGSYLGSVPNGEWHRLALAVNLVDGTFTSYVDGVKVEELTGQTLDGRFSLYSLNDGASEGFLLFADESGDNAEGYVNAVQARDVTLCPEDVAAIGGILDGPLTPVAIPPKLCAPPPPPNLALKEGPYLQWATKSEITVMWETTVAADSSVFYRRSGGPWVESSEARTRKIHEMRLSGFSPQETVEYYIRSRQGAAAVTSGTYTFQTQPDQEIPFNFVIWGDNHVNPPVFGALVNSMASKLPEMGLCVGDVVDNGNVYEEWGRGLLTPLLPLSRFAPFYVAIGNHEGNAHWFYDYMAQPGNEHWFSFDYAGCHFVLIDSNFPFGPGSEQYDWLQADLFSEAAQKAKWLFTFHHHPPYSEIYEEVIYARVRMHLVPLYEAAGVDINFTGHIHDYERGVYVPPDTGRRIAYIQTSGAGGRLWDDEFNGVYEQIQKVIQYVYHYCEVSIQGDMLSFQAIDLQGRVIDSFTLTRLPRSGEPPPPPPPPEPGGKAITQWDFDSGDLTATFGPGTLQFMDGASGGTAARTAFGTTASFGIPAIRGQVGGVMRFPKASSPSLGFMVKPEAPGNGGGTYVNQYTMVLDLLVPASSFSSDAWLAFFQTSTGNTDDGELFAKLDSGGIGISGEYQGRILSNAWQRVSAIFQNEGGEMTLHKYIDGVEVGSQPLGPPDGRWAINQRGSGSPWFLLFTDNDGETSSAYISSLLFADKALSPSEIASLGGPDAGGIARSPCFSEPCKPFFRRGDSNGDSSVDIADAIFTLLYLFAGGARTVCPKSLDVNDDGAVQITDAIYALEFLFLRGPLIKPPSPVCGEDPTEDALECEPPGPCG